MPYTIPSSVISPGAVYQPRKSKLILDQIPGAIAAWSTRRLISSAPADIARGRDASTTEQDFTAAELAGSGFTDLAGAGYGFYVTLYDQIGSNNATQATAASQPKGVSLGALMTDDGGVPVVDFLGVNNIMPANTLGATFSGITIVFKFFTGSSINLTIPIDTGTSTSNRVTFLGVSDGRLRFYGVETTVQFDIYSDAAINDSTWHTIIGTYEPNSSKMYIDGVLQSSVDTTCSVNLSSSFVCNIGRSAFSASNNITAKMNDIIIFNRALTLSEASTLHTVLA